MINNLQIYLTTENIYLVTNWGVIPLWLLLIFAPNNNFTKLLVNSVVVPLILGSAYLFISYKLFLDGSIVESFNLYLGLTNLYAIYSNEDFLLVFWLHFLSISLFVGSWIARDSIRYNIPKFLSSICLILTYFTGPVGLVLYWLIRIFFAKKINLDE
tara:strand:+ start:2913 stop:3383 length:471 start_codon:yes stop_codon:yes gene_type:complete